MYYYHVAFLVTIYTLLNILFIIKLFLLYLFKQNNTVMNYKLDKYKMNLTIRNNEVWSYNTHVATIADAKLIQLGWWSMTTQKHINYVADQYDLDLIK